jgi:hypothetical protein
MSWNGPADRGNKLVHERGLGRQSGGPAGLAVSLRTIESDVRTVVSGMLARGIHRERVAALTGAPLQIVRIIEATLRV